MWVQALHMVDLVKPLFLAVQELDRKKVKNWDMMADNFFRFMMDNFPTELTVMGAKIALTNYNLPFDASKLKNFDEFHQKYGKYIVNAG